MKNKIDLFPEELILNGQKTAVRSLLQTRGSGEPWKQEWLDFLREWYATSDGIEVHTSGSTGTPKIIRLKKDFVAASAMRTIRFFRLQPKDRVLHCLPSRYIAGKLMVVRALIGKLDLFVCNPSDPEKQLAKTRFRFAAMVPNQVIKLFDRADEKFQLDYLLIGGAAIPESLYQRLQGLATGCYSSYAMTETATHIALRRLNGAVADADYHCLSGISVRSASSGCLRIEMQGLEQGFLETTDLAEVKDKHTFRILGRADDIIISGGIKYMPEKIEKKIDPFLSVPFVISSLPHDLLGQQLILVLETSEDCFSKEELQQLCRQHLTNYECPRLIYRLNSFPRTTTGKIKRRDIPSFLSREN